MSTRFDSSLLARQGRVLPENRSARGNNYRNVFEAKLWDYDGGRGYEAGAIPQDEYVDFLLFTMDVPIVLRATVFYGTATSPDTFGPANYFEYPIVVSDLAAGYAVMVPDNVAVGIDEQQAGLTTTNGVRVTGYAGWWFNTDRDLLSEQTPLTAQAWLMCIAKGAVQDGPIWSESDYQGSAYLNVPILLHEPHYTQAMRDAGNVIVAGATTYEICGLYEIWLPQ